MIRTFLGWKSSKNNIEPYQNFPAFYKRRRCTGWNSKAVEHQWSKGRNINKLWERLSNMLINTGLDLKTRFVSEKRKHVKREKSSTLVQNSLKCGVVFLLFFFLQVIIFKGPSLIFVLWCLLKPWLTN